MGDPNLPISERESVVRELKPRGMIVLGSVFIVMGAVGTGVFFASQSEFTSETLLGLIPLIFVILGGIAVYVGVQKLRAHDPNASTGGVNSIGGAVVPTECSTLPSYDSSGRAVALKPASRLGKFIALLSAAAFILFIVRFVSDDVIRGWNKDRADWILTIILSVLGLVGVGLLAGAIRAFLALFNPSPRLRVNAAAIPLGGVLRLEWKFAGDVARIRDLRIYLRGREAATYDEGSSSWTDTLDFLELDIVRLNDPRSMRTGRVELVIPIDAMHSVECGSNKIIWSLVVWGDIKNWPDVKDEFPIVILPVGPIGM